MLIRRLRLITGLVLALFVTLHFFNHAAGLLSLDAMEAVRKTVTLLWHNPIGAFLLYASLLTHFLLALWSLYQRSNLRLKPWEAIQLGFGLLMLPLAAAHIIGTRARLELLNIDVTYPQIVTILWQNPAGTAKQILLMAIVWGHMVVGLHFWLRLKKWYPTAQPYLFLGATLLPTLALMGFVRAGLAVDAADAQPGWTAAIFGALKPSDPSLAETHAMLEPIALTVMAALLIAVLIARQIRRAVRTRIGAYRLRMPSGAQVTASVGTTMLEAIRAAGIPHASVCGGRGRCTTCRVRISDGGQALPTPNETEALALRRIEAPENVRLACQTRPRRDTSIVPLLPPTATAQAARQLGSVQGQEQAAVVMFLDLRDSTALGERLLPYDTVFILNQFFAEMSAGLRETAGHYAQFNGDGLMAIYGLQTGVEAGCREALEGAVALHKRLAQLNETLGTELGQSLRMGIGIHCGEAIVGTMGPPDAPTLTAVGDNVNIAARLEALTKTYECSVVVSRTVADTSGLDLNRFALHKAPIRGRDKELEIFAVDDTAKLAEILDL
jgi:adenylate cyclase